MDAQRAVVTRRRALAGLGAGVAAGWVAPSITSAPVAAAAASRGCPSCDAGNLVLNGDAESGAMAPWSSSGDPDPPFSVEAWATLTGLGLVPPAATGTNAFAMVGPPPEESASSIVQAINFGPGCGDALVELKAVLGALALGTGSTSTLFATVDFVDGGGASLGPGTVGAIGLSAVVDDSPVFALESSTSGFMPAGAVSAQVTVSWWGNPTANPLAVVAAAVDNISFTLSCLA